MILDVFNLEIFYKSDQTNASMRRKVMVGCNSDKFVEFVSQSQTRSFFGDEDGPNFIGQTWFNRINN